MRRHAGRAYHDGSSHVTGVQQQLWRTGRPGLQTCEGPIPPIDRWPSRKQNLSKRFKRTQRDSEH